MRVMSMCVWRECETETERQYVSIHTYTYICKERQPKKEYMRARARASERESHQDRERDRERDTRIHLWLLPRIRQHVLRADFLGVVTQLIFCHRLEATAALRQH